MAQPAHATVSGFFADALGRARHLVAEANRVSDLEYRTNQPQEVANLIGKLAAQAQKALAQEWDEYRSSAETREAALRMAQTWDGLVRKAGGHLRYLHGATAGRVPGALSSLLDAVVTELGLGEAVLLREKWNYNYSVNVVSIHDWYRQPLSGLLSAAQLDEIFGPRSQAYCIAFPALERDNVLMHAAIAHEVGHLAVERWLRLMDDHDANVAASIGKAATELVPADPAGQQEFEVYTRRAHAAEVVQRARRRFLQEYGSDIFAVELFGPAAVFAMSSVALSVGLDSEPRRNSCYPSWAARLRVAMDWLERGDGLADGVGPWCPLAKPDEGDGSARRVHARVSARLAEVNAMAAGATAPSDEYLRAADDLAKARLGELGIAIRGVVRGEQPSPDTMVEQAFVLAERIRNRIPPNDIGTDQVNPAPPLLSAIMNAAWFSALDEVPEAERDETGMPGERWTARINRLVLKSLEDVTLLRRLKVFRETGTA